MRFIIGTIILTILMVNTLRVFKILFVKFPGNDTVELFGSEIMGTGLNLIGLTLGLILFCLLFIIWDRLLSWEQKE